jgi:hypothetical protein
MALESGTYVKDLVDTNPTGTDPISLGDDHIRLIKKVLGNSFPSSISAATVPDVSGNGEKYLQVNTGATGTQWASVDVRSRGSLNRSQFDHSSDTVLLIGAGQYDHDGTTVQDVYWNSQISFTIGSGGSNSGSSAAGTSQWQYLYLDDSAIVTQGAALLDADCFLNSTTAPTYDQSKHGWYNASVTNDRCIFAFYIDGSGNITEFFNDGGDMVLYADGVTESSLTASTTWADVTLRMPSFSTKGTVLFWGDAGGIAGTPTKFWWRTNGQSGSTGHLAAKIEDDDAEWNTMETVVMTDSTQKIEIKANNTNSLVMRPYTQGYYFPGGM